MDWNEVGLKIARKIQKDPFDAEGYRDYYGVNLEIWKEDKAGAVRNLKGLTEQMGRVIPELSGKDLGEARRLMELHRHVLLKLAPEDFDSYMLFTEWNREPEKKCSLRRFTMKVPEKTGHLLL